MWINLEPEELELAKAALRQGGRHGAILALIDKIEKAQETKPSDAVYRNAVETSDDLEVDEDAVVSPGSDPGAWVHAWVWVANDTVDICPTCGDFPGSETYGTVGDGYDGLCPSCADKAEEAE